MYPSVFFIEPPPPIGWLVRGLVAMVSDHACFEPNTVFFYVFPASFSAFLSLISDRQSNTIASHYFHTIIKDIWSATPKTEFAS